LLKKLMSLEPSRTGYISGTLLDGVSRRVANLPDVTCIVAKWEEERAAESLEAGMGRKSLKLGNWREPSA
jgi:hypothetical protein